MKKLFAILLSLVIAAAGTACISAEYKEGEKLKSGSYTYVIRGGKAQIIRYNGKEKNVVVPSRINGYIVDKVGSDVELITGIGSSKADVDENGYYEDREKSGFEKTKVESVVIPDTVTEIGINCFADCEKLRRIILSKNLKFIPAEMCSGCKALKNIKIPDKVTEICAYAFGQTAIRNIKIPDSVRVINTDSFGDKLTNISCAKGNKRFSSQNGVLYNKKKTKLLNYPMSKPDKSFKIPKTVREIGVNSISSQKYLENLIVSKGVRRMDKGALLHCEKLRKLELNPRGKKKIVFEKGAFEYCKKLKKVNLPASAVLENRSLGYYDIGLSSEGDYPTKIKGFTIYGVKGSPAEKYAAKNGFRFIAVN